MKAIILAAGYGRRMRPLTDHEHKTLLEISGRTIISRIIDGLLENGVADIVVATGYLANRLENYLRENYPQAHFTFVENRDYDNTNNIHSLALVFEAVVIDDDILLIESDLIYEPAVIRKIIDAPQANVALVDRYRRGMDGTVVTLANGIITSIIPPHLQGQNFDFSDKYKTLNIYKFSQAFCNDTFKKLLRYYTSVVDQNAYYEWLLGILIYVQKATIHAAVIAQEKWAEVDDPNDLAVASFIFNKDERLKILQQACGGYWNYEILDFCYLRNMYFPTPALRSELKNNLDNLLFNYGSKQEALDQKLANFLLCRAECVTLLNGASQIFPLLQTFFSGQQILLPRPSFGEYERVFPAADFYADRDGISTAEIEERALHAGAVIFVNPNNPTGSLIHTEWILGFAQRHSEKEIIVDESFIDFAPAPSALPFLDARPVNNLTIIKSLSKALGVPGLRLGFVYSCNRRLNDFIRKNIPIWNSNSVAENFLECILKHREALAQSFRQTIRDREAFAADLRALEFVDKVFASAGNFLLARFKGRAEAFKELPRQLLADAGIYVKDVSEKFGDGRFYLRLAVRLPEENRELIDALDKLIEPRG